MNSATATKASERIPVRCNECGKTWRVSPNALLSVCTKCGGADIDVVEGK